MFFSFLPFFYNSTSYIVKSSNTNQEPIYWPTDGWRTSSPDEEDVSSVKLQEIYEYLDSTTELRFIRGSLRSLLIIRNGYLIHETYFSSFADANTTLNIYSCTKSVTSSLIGIAIEKGYIGGVDDLVLDYFPNRTIANRNNWKEAMTIEDMLTMKSGFEWDESDYSRPDNDYTLMYASECPVQYVLDKPMANAPGNTWEYNTGCSHLLSAIIDNTTGVGTQEFAQTYLFNPLGIDPPHWAIDDQDVPYGGSNLRITPRQMAKFGFLFLNNGTWDEQQLIPKEWVTTSTQSTNYPSWYAYQWWNEPHRNSFSAHGYKGQQIVIIPDHNMVVVFSANTNLIGNLYNTIIDNYIIPAIGYIPPTSTASQATKTAHSSIQEQTSETTTTVEVSSFCYLAIVIIILSSLGFVRRKKQ
jgi:CubicO group peptidase (beta-lactamase class C family)